LPDAVGAARPTLHHVRLIHAGGKRDRRPTPDQIEKIFAWFAERVQCVQCLKANRARRSGAERLLRVTVNAS